MNAKITSNQRVSDLLNDCLVAYNDAETNSELISTEEFLHHIDQSNSKIREGTINGDDFCIGSLDVENLYGSIDTKTACKLIREKVMNSPLRIPNRNKGGDS